MAAKKKATKKEENKIANVEDYAVLLGPIVTEKGALAGNGATFKVDKRASKDEIKSAVERVFNVLVQSVRTSNILGKPKRSARTMGRRAGYKKAYVTLKEGYKLDIIEGL
jgi:large subunit ribosomal protein L23